MCKEKVCFVVGNSNRRRRRRMMVKGIQVQLCGFVTQRWTLKPRTSISISSLSPISHPYLSLKLLPTHTTPRTTRFAPFRASSSLQSSVSSLSPRIPCLSDFLRSHVIFVADEIASNFRSIYYS